MPRGLAPSTEQPGGSNNQQQQTYLGSDLGFEIPLSSKGTRTLPSVPGKYKVRLECLMSEIEKVLKDDGESK